MAEVFGWGSYSYNHIPYVHSIYWHRRKWIGHSPIREEQIVEKPNELGFCELGLQ